MKINNFFKCIISIILVEGVGIISGVLTNTSVTTWYSNLEKSNLNPPAWIFGPVWTILYFLMAVAAFLVWKKGFQKKGVKIALSTFIFQLLLNFLWSIFFFGLHNPLLALIDIVLLWLAILGTMVLFYKISRPAMYLLLPYLLWVSFASYLNYTIWILN